MRSSLLIGAFLIILGSTLVAYGSSSPAQTVISGCHITLYSQPVNGASPLSVNLTAISSNSNGCLFQGPITYDFNFGDGNSKTGLSPVLAVQVSHTYTCSSPTLFTAQVQFSDQQGDIGSGSWIVYCGIYATTTQGGGTPLLSNINNYQLVGIFTTLAGFVSTGFGLKKGRSR